MDKTINISISTDELSRAVFKSLALMYVADVKDLNNDTKKVFKRIFLENTDSLINDINKVAEKLISGIGMSEHASIVVEIK